MPGVKAVITAADLPEVSAAMVDQEEGIAVNYGFYSRNVMAREKALYKGHVVAAVAAISPHVAEEALALIDVDYEVLTPVLNAEDAMKDGAPLLHERLVTQSSPGARAGGYGQPGATKGSNIPTHFEFRSGHIGQGFKDAHGVGGAGWVGRRPSSRGARC